MDTANRGRAYPAAPGDAPSVSVDFRTEIHGTRELLFPLVSTTRHIWKQHLTPANIGLS